MKFRSMIIVLACVLISCSKPGIDTSSLYPAHKPYTRWWWFASVIEENDIASQLLWMKEMGFGGVEIAFIYPVGRDPDAQRLAWLGPEWQARVAYAKKTAAKLGMGCDFTFGTLWPFGGTFVSDKDRTKVFGDTAFKQPLRLSWTHPDTGNVLDHLNRKAFERYAKVMGGALAPAMAQEGPLSAIFCDSWEVETRRIWTDGFGGRFRKRFGYDIAPYMPGIYSMGNEDALYDYMTLVSETVIREFYRPFTAESRRLKGFSRVQVAGAPVDLLTAYAETDVPETEAMLYEPDFSRIVASAAALSGKAVVSSETFTCMYGYPKAYHRQEKVEDLKMLADALFARGVNQIIWHGMPFNPAGKDTNEFYATVHVGYTGALAPHLRAFNDYMTEMSGVMRKGKLYSDVALYLPLEDAWRAGEYPDSLQLPWSWGQYELRYLAIPKELQGYQPLWIDGHFLKKARLEGGLLRCGDAVFRGLYIDVKALDGRVLDTLLELAGKGFPICLKRDPEEPGMRKSGTYADRLARLKAFPNVSAEFKSALFGPPLVDSESPVDFWCRRDGDTYYLFFPHPKAYGLHYPLAYHFSECRGIIRTAVTLNIGGRVFDSLLRFEPYQGVLLKIGERVETVHTPPFKAPAPEGAGR